MRGFAEALRYFINGPEELPPEYYKPKPDRHKEAFEFIERTGLKFELDAQNRYNQNTDRLFMRPVETFRSYGHYLATIFHEMAHWTGPRLGRLMPVQSEPGYPQEEVIAEVCSLHICYCLFLDGTDFGHKDYITHWARGFDERTFLRCVDEGMRASQYLRERGRLANRH